MKIIIHEKACISCGACVVLCPSGAIRLVKGRAVLDQEKCVQCRRCINKCYARAIEEVDNAD